MAYGLVFTEPIHFVTHSLDGNSAALPEYPTGDEGRNIRQITIRGTDKAWEWKIEGQGNGWMWMDTGDVLVLPLANPDYGDNFRFRRAAGGTGSADMRIIFEA